MEGCDYVLHVVVIHVAALKNEKANGKRFIFSAEKAHKGAEMAEILKENGYSKVSTKLAPNFSRLLNSSSLVSQFH